MKKTILQSVLVAFLITTSFISCSNEPMQSHEMAIASKPPPIGLSGLFYKEGGATSLSSVSISVAKNSYKTIFGIDGSDVIEINLSSLAVGTYTIGSFNKFYYKKPGTTKTWVALTGTVTITLNASGKLSGTFNMTSGTGIPSVNSVSGIFESIDINP